MSYLLAIMFFVLGVIEFFWGDTTYLAIGWFAVAGLFNIAGGIVYGRNR